MNHCEHMKGYCVASTLDELRFNAERDRAFITRLQAERNLRVESTALGKLSEALEEDNFASAATLVRSPTSPAVVDMFITEKMEVAAGVKQQLEMDAKRVGGVRLLPGRFMVIEQAMGVPKGRLGAQAWLSGFIEEMKASGFVADGLKRHGIEGASVAPARASR